MMRRLCSNNHSGSKRESIAKYFDISPPRPFNKLLVKWQERFATNREQCSNLLSRKLFYTILKSIQCFIQRLVGRFPIIHLTTFHLHSKFSQLTCAVVL